MKKYFLFLTLFSAVFTSTAQKRPGYVVMENGDTLKGNIRFREWANNSDSIVIYFENSNKINRVLFSENCRLLVLSDPAEVYEKWTVTMEMSVIDKSTYLVKNEDSTRTATVFLKKIYDGEKISLYRFSDEKDHFFVLTNGKMEELLMTYKTYKPKTIEYNTASYSSFHRFRDQLQQFYDWQSEKKLTNKINRTNYAEDDLTEIIGWIDKGSRQKDLLPNGAYYNIYAGIAFRTLLYNTENFQTKESVQVKLDPGKFLLFGVGARFFTKRDVQRTFLNAGLQYYSMNFSGDHIFEFLYPTIHERHVYTSQKKLVSLVTGLGQRIPLNSNTSINLFVNGNFSMLINSVLKIDIYDNTSGQYKRTENFDFKSHQTFQVTAGGSIDLKRNFELGVLYQSPFNIDKTLSQWSKISGISVTLSYLRPFKKMTNKTIM